MTELCGHKLSARILNMHVTTVDNVCDMGSNRCISSNTIFLHTSNKVSFSKETRRICSTFRDLLSIYVDNLTLLEIRNFFISSGLPWHNFEETFINKLLSLSLKLLATCLKDDFNHIVGSISRNTTKEVSSNERIDFPLSITQFTATCLSNRSDWWMVTCIYTLLRLAYSILEQVLRKLAPVR